MMDHRVGNNHEVKMKYMVHHNHEVEMEGVVPHNGSWENYDEGEMMGNGACGSS